MEKQTIDKLMDIKKLYEAGILTEEEYHEQKKNLITSCSDVVAVPKGFYRKYLGAVIFSLCIIVLSGMEALKITFAARYFGHLPTPANRIAQLILYELLAMVVLAVPAISMDYPKKKKVYYSGIVMVMSFFLIAVVSYFVDLTVSNYLFIVFWLLSPLAIVYALRTLPQNIKKNTQEANGELLYLVFILSVFLPPVGIGFVGIGIIGILWIIFIRENKAGGVLTVRSIMFVPALLLLIGFFATEGKSSPIDAVKMFVSDNNNRVIIVSFDEAKCHPLEEEINIKSNELTIYDDVKGERLNNDEQIAYVPAKYKGRDVTFIVKCWEGKACVLSTVGLYTYDFTAFRNKYGFTLEYKDDLSPELQSADAVECANVVRDYIKKHDLHTSVFSVKLVDYWYFEAHEYEVRCTDGMVFTVVPSYNKSQNIIVWNIKKINHNGTADD